MNYKQVVWIILLAVACFSLIIYATPYGLGVSPDSVMYMSAARSLREGSGLRTLQTNGSFSFMSHFPPLFSFILSLLPEMLQHTALVLQGVILVGSILLVGDITFKLTRNNQYSKLAQILVLVSNPVLYVHTQVWTEPLMIIGILSIVALLIRYSETKKSWILAALLAVTILLPFARYAALFLLPLVWIFIVLIEVEWKPFLFLKQVFEQKTRSYALGISAKLVGYGLLLIAPYELWQKYVQSQQATVRVIATHIIPLAKILQGIKIVVWWVLPADFGGVINYGTFLLLLVIGVIFFKKYVAQIKNAGAQAVTEGKPNNPLIQGSRNMLFIMSIILGYIAFLAISISFFDGATPLDTRILSPIFPLVIIFVTFVLFCSTRSNSELFSFNNVLKAFSLLIAITTLYRGIMYLKTSRSEGQTNTALVWQTSETIQALTKLPTTTFLVSNSQEAIYSITGITSAQIPTAISSFGNVPLDYGKVLLGYWKGDVCVVYFTTKNPSIRKRYPTLEQVEDVLKPYKEYSYQDGKVLCRVKTK